MSTNNFSKKFIKDSLFSNLSKLPINLIDHVYNSNIRNIFEDDVFLTIMGNYIGKRLYGDIQEAEYYIKNEPECKHFFSKFDISTDSISRIADASGLNKYKFQELKERVTEAAKNIIDRLLADQDKSLGCWMYLRDESGAPTTNPWVSASCLYSLKKSSMFIEAKSDEIDIAIKKALVWFFRSDVLCKSGDNHGWTQYNFVENKTCENPPQLHDTAYVLNVLIRTTDMIDNEYYYILKTLLNLPSAKVNGWIVQDKDNSMDIPGTCYCLRLISNFLDLLKTKKDSFTFDIPKSEIEDLQLRMNLICLSLVREQRENKYWKALYPKPSDQATTALAIHALRSAGRLRSWEVIENGCNWLIDRLCFADDKWCWIENTDNGIAMPCIHDSSLCIAALLKGSTFNKFSRAEAVILWLLKQIDKDETGAKNDLHPIDRASILCAFANYLRAFQEPGFYNIDFQSSAFHDENISNLRIDDLKSLFPEDIIDNKTRKV